MFKTNDPRRAAFLWARGYSIKSIEGERGRKSFIFGDEIPDEIQQAFSSSPEKKALDRHAGAEEDSRDDELAAALQAVLNVVEVLCSAQHFE